MYVLCRTERHHVNLFCRCLRGSRFRFSVRVYGFLDCASSRSGLDRVWPIAKKRSSQKKKVADTRQENQVLGPSWRSSGIFDGVWTDVWRMVHRQKTTSGLDPVRPVDEKMISVFSSTYDTIHSYLWYSMFCGYKTLCLDIRFRLSDLWHKKFQCENGVDY